MESEKILRVIEKSLEKKDVYINLVYDNLENEEEARQLSEKVAKHLGRTSQRVNHQKDEYWYEVVGYDEDVMEVSFHVRRGK